MKWLEPAWILTSLFPLFFTVCCNRTRLLHNHYWHYERWTEGDMTFFTWEFCWEAKRSPHRSRCKCHGKLHLSPGGVCFHSSSETMWSCGAGKDLSGERDMSGVGVASRNGVTDLCTCQTAAERSKEVHPYIAPYSFKIQASPFALSSTLSLILQLFILRHGTRSQSAWFIVTKGNFWVTYGVGRGRW